MRRPRGGSEAGPTGRREGLLGPGPDLPAVALFSSADPRRDWGLRLGLRDWTAPGNPDSSSVQLVRSSHLARAPTTDCEVVAVRGRCPPAALSIPLARISEQVPGAGTGLQGGREDWARQAGVQIPKCERDPGDASARCAWLAERVDGVGVRGGGCSRARHCTVGAGSGRFCRPSFSESCLLNWGARRWML